MGTAAQPSPVDVQARDALEKVRRDILDLSRRNPLLNYREPKVAHLELDATVTRWALGQAVDTEAGVELVSAEMGDGAGLRTAYSPEDLDRRCERLLRLVRSAEQETGLNILYLAAGELIWYESETSRDENHAPLLLLPLSLQRGALNRRSGFYSYSVKAADEEGVINVCLTERFRRDFGFELPAWGGEADSVGDYGRRLAGLLGERFPRWRVQARLCIGLFNFSNLAIYRDLEIAGWPEGARPDQNRITRVLLRGRDPESGPERTGLADETRRVRVDPEELPLISALDTSQYLALYEGLRGPAPVVVIQGPPGTGKSETITNLIAAALQEGKRVLFVAAKHAALDVVRTRLQRAELGSMLFSTDARSGGRDELWHTLGQRVAMVEATPGTLEAEREERERRRRVLKCYCDAVHRPNARGETTFELYWKYQQAEKDWGGGPAPDPGVPDEAIRDRDAGDRCAQSVDAAARIRRDVAEHV